MKVCSVCQRCFEDSALSCSEVNHPLLSEGRAGNCQMIANYRLEFLLESSPTGETYRAASIILKKPYLIKILAPELFDENSGKQFLRETHDLSAIIHPNVARVFESGTLADGSIYVVTEFFTAQTLRDCLTNVGAPSEVTALTITRQAAEGLEATHAAGILHGNICPENIVLTSDAENRFLVKLQNIDFGSVRQKNVNSNAELNLDKLRYFSPEQCALQTIDAQTDVYSLGVVLYETLAGQPPFDAPDARALINKQINEPPPPVAIHNFDIRMLLTHTLTDALQKTTRLRLKTANAFARRLRHIEQLATHSPTPPPAIAYPAAMNKSAARFAPSPKIEEPVAAEVQTVIENSVSLEDQTAAEKPEALVKHFPDLSTTKLPPIESVIGFAENEPNVQTEQVFYKAAESSAIDMTNEAVLIEWEQPDDIPTIKETLKTEKKAIVDAKLMFIDDEDLTIDTDEVDSRFENVLQAEENRGNHAAPRSVLFYADSVRSWNFPDQRKILTGAGLAALFLLAVGGTLLNRQTQLTRDAQRTTAQSSPNGKSLPKSAERDKVSENDKDVKTQGLTVSDSPDNADTPELSDYQLRDISEKPVVSVSQNPNKKRAYKETPDSRAKTIQTKTVSSETSSDDNKAEPGTPADKMSNVKSQGATNPDIFTRPRIVKNPKF